MNDTPSSLMCIKAEERSEISVRSYTKSRSWINQDCFPGMMYWFKQSLMEVHSCEEYINSFTKTEHNRPGSLEMVNYKQKIYLITTCLVLNQSIGPLN